MGHKYFEGKKRLPKRVEVVYCKDCKHFGIYDAYRNSILGMCMYYNNRCGYEDWYCPEGEKAEPEDLMSCIGGSLIRRVDAMKCKKCEYESEENKND